MRQRMTSLQHYPNNYLYEAYSAVLRIAANTLDMLVMCIGSLDHYDAITLLWDADEPGLVQVHVLLASHRNCLT
jgi:hypothetical protein